MMRTVTYFNLANDEDSYSFFVDEVGNVSISLALLDTILTEAGHGRDGGSALF
jgi:hypothetical protein